MLFPSGGQGEGRDKEYVKRWKERDGFRKIFSNRTDHKTWTNLVGREWEEGMDRESRRPFGLGKTQE